MELMIVVAIIGILAAVGYPAYTNSVKKGNRADGISGMLQLAGRMEEYYMNNDSYDGAAVVNPTSPEGLYKLSLAGADGTGAPDAFGYEIKATPTSTDSACGYLTLNSLGQKGVEKGTVANCW